MKSALPHLGLIIVLASSLTAQAQLDQIPYYIAGAASNEFLAKPMGKWVAQDLLSLNKTNPLTSIAGQDLKFVFASAFQSWLSYALPALGKLPEDRAQTAVASTISKAISSVSEMRPGTPAVYTPSVLRQTASAADLHAEALHKTFFSRGSTTPLGSVAETNSVEMVPLSSSSTSMSSTSSASSAYSPSESSSVATAVVPVAAEDLAKNNAVLTKVFKAGGKYIAISEFVEYVEKIAEAWEKVHAHAPVVSATNNQTAVIQFSDQCPLDEESKLNPIVWFHWIEDRAKDAGHMSGTVFKELWNDKAMTMYVAVHLAVSYFVTRSSMLASRAFREMVFVNRGYGIFKMDPIKQITETSMGVLMSFFVKQFITMPYLSEASRFFGINTNVTGKLADAAYMAGIKLPFAYDAVLDTLYDADDINHAHFLAGGIPVAMLASFFAMDRMYPFIRKIVTGSLFIVQLGAAYYVNRCAQPRVRPAR